MNFTTVVVSNDCLWISFLSVEMADQQDSRSKTYLYQNVQLFKTDSLGTGSYGAVCKAKLDQLTCAAKLLHPVFFQFSDSGQSSAVKKFEQECQLLSTIKHPNIVQFLGTALDPDSGLPLLLMELMDESLTHFLEGSPEPLPLCTQVNFCHDVSLALAYLHSNRIVHRDLSSNNVLLIAGNRAKVTDFGMSKVVEGDSCGGVLLTMCPGTLVYMPPEALQTPPIYSHKLDCFSFGVLGIQIITRQFPDPGPAVKVLEDASSPVGKVQVPVPDTERRGVHINLIDPQQPLLPLIHSCLNYDESKRPFAQELCDRLAEIKESPEYLESQQRLRNQSSSEVAELTKQVQVLSEQLCTQDNELNEKEKVLAVNTAQVEHLQRKTEELQEQLGIVEESARAALSAKEEDLERCSQELSLQVNSLQEQLKFREALIKSRESQIEEMSQKIDRMTEQLSNQEQAIQERESQIEVMENQMQQAMQEREERIKTTEKQMRELNRQLRHARTEVLQTQMCWQDSKKSLGEKTAEICRLQQELKLLGSKLNQKATNGGMEDSPSLFWRTCRRAPCVMSRGSAAVDGNVAYFRPAESRRIWAFHLEREMWQDLPQCHQDCSALVVVSSLLTAVGGKRCGRPCNSVLSFNHLGDMKWHENLPPMPTGCYNSTAVFTRSVLVVAGGRSDNDETLKTVQLLSTESLQWAMASCLPHPLSLASATVVGDNLYLLGGLNEVGRKTRSVFTCSLSNLLCPQANELSSQGTATSPPVWLRAADVPKYRSTCATLLGRLIAVGGSDSDDNATASVRVYDPSNNSWEVVSRMHTARDYCLLAVFPSNKLMVVGGYTSTSVTDSVEVVTPM